MYINSVVARCSEAYIKLFEIINFTVLTSVNIIVYFILYIYNIIYLSIYLKYLLFFFKIRYC